MAGSAKYWLGEISKHSVVSCFRGGTDRSLVSFSVLGQEERLHFCGICCNLGSPTCLIDQNLYACAISNILQANGLIRYHLDFVDTNYTYCLSVTLSGFSQVCVKLLFSPSSCLVLEKLWL